MDAVKCLKDISPPVLKELLDRRELRGVEELRLRAGRPPSLTVQGAERELDGTVTPALIGAFLEKATGASLHSYENSVANGFIPYRGLRIGICGEAIIRGGRVCGYRSISSVNVRLPGEHKGCTDKVYRQLTADRGGILIISPPGGGKTTALRELIRKMGDEGIRVSVSDERNELSASHLGQRGFDLGRCTDVTVGAPKAEGAIQLLRGMSPEVIAMDEISSPEDMAAVREICACGVMLLATCHGREREELMNKPALSQLLEQGAFSKLLVISSGMGHREYRAEVIR